MFYSRDSQARGDTLARMQQVESESDSDDRNPNNSCLLQMSLVDQRDQLLFSLGSWIALIDPIGAEIVSNIKHLDVGETHRTQGVAGRFDVRAMAPRAATAIKNDELVSGQRLNPLAQLLQAAVAQGRTKVLGSGNMRPAGKGRGIPPGSRAASLPGAIEEF